MNLMKILFVGAFKNKWSTNIQMVLELKKKNHKVICFDYRFKENITNFQHFQINQLFKISLKLFIRQNYINFISKIENINLPFFKFLIRINRYYLFGRWNINRQLINEVKSGKYDLVFLAKTDSINYKLIPKINKYAKTWYFFMDPLKIAININAYKYALLSKWSSATFTSVNSLFKREGANSYFITQGFDPVVFKPSENNFNKKIDVIFVGSFNLKRKNYVNFLEKNNISIICYGSGWKNKPIYLERLVYKYRASKIILNFTEGKIGFSVRVFQAMGTGSFLISEYCKDLEKIFKKGVHLDWFKTPNELLKIVNYYLKNEIIREDIARQGYKYVLENFTWEHIMNKIIQIIYKNKDII